MRGEEIMFVNYLKKVVLGEELTSSEAYNAIDLLLSDEVEDNQAAAFFAALRARRETADELFGFASALMDRALKCEGIGNLLDTCGTGGDGQNTFNISTAAAIICATCGVRVAKHGNRAVTSNSGSADVLEALGIRTNLDRDEARQALDEIGIAFLFAPLFHPVMKKFGPMRRSLGIATAFNFLGPLINPFCPDYQILGISDPLMMKPMATALSKLGRKRALVVHAVNGMDEISPVGITLMARIDEHGIRQEQLDPAQLGFTAADLTGIRGGNAAENAQIIKNVLAGTPGPAREVVLLNTAAALMITGLATDLTGGMELAAQAIDSGQAQAKLRQMIMFGRESRAAIC